MKILKAKHYGMCFGVRDAIEMAKTEAQHQPLTILGDLVHNESVLASLRAKGIRIAQSQGEVRTHRLMITAHGAAEKSIEEAHRAGFSVIEATCPLVRVAHNALARLVRDGHHPVVIGKRGHVEVRGLTGDFADCDIILSESDADGIQERARFGVIAQTTQPIERVRELVAYMRNRFPQSEVRFVDTVCQPTKQRQNAAGEMACQSEVVVVIGGAHSNNTRELVETCRRYCAHVYHVQTEADLDPNWFRGVTTVGLTAGTSTPDDVIDRVENWLRALEAPALSSPVAVPARAPEAVHHMEAA